MIINSILDNDLYKFTMQQVVWHKFSGVNVEYVFTNRSNAPLEQHIDEIREEINHLGNLKLTKEEKQFLMSLSFLKPAYVEFLGNIQLNPEKYVIIKLDENKKLSIRIVGGWVHTILFEVPILAIVSEIYSKYQTQQKGMDKEIIHKNALERLAKKKEIVKGCNGFKFADFGTRRRFSHSLHSAIIKDCITLFGGSFVGTSNVYLAMKYGLTPIGTMAHEYLMAHQQIYNLKGHQLKALNNWAEEYQGKLGIVLTDTLTSDAFLKDFHLGHAKLFDGIRQDSGDPYQVCEKFIKHYENLGIDPKTKTIIFSDSLNFPKAKKLYDTFKGRINISFGIGTNLCNDIEFVEAPGIVIKLAKVFGLPVAKISDSPGKELCENMHYLNYLKGIIKK